MRDSVTGAGGLIAVAVVRGQTKIIHVSDWDTEVTPMMRCSDSIAKMLGLKSHLSKLCFVRWSQLQLYNSLPHDIAGAE